MSRNGKTRLRMESGKLVELVVGCVLAVCSLTSEILRVRRNEKKKKEKKVGKHSG